MKNTRIKVDIVSDVVCPWCYIGKRRFEAAMASLPPNIEVTIRHLPFELNPHLPAAGTDQRQHLTDKFGGDDRYEQLTARVTSVAKDEGLNYRFDLQQVLPNTLDAHRLIQFAATSGHQDAVVEGLMKAYFEEGIDLSNKENLLDIAAKAGVDRQAASQLLQSDHDVSAIRQMEKLNQERGISGVPFFIINDKYGVSGAQPTETFIQILKEITSENVAVV